MANRVRRAIHDDRDRAGIQRARQQDGAKREGADAAPLPGGGVPAAQATLLAEPAPQGRGYGPAHGAMMRQAQQTFGNQAIQRMLQRPAWAPTVQAEAAPEEDAIQRTPGIIVVDGEEQILQHMADDAEPLQRHVEDDTAGAALQRKPDVPNLSKATETTAKPLLSGSASDKQKAIDAVVKNMVKNGDMSLSKIKDKKVYYNAATAGEGLTSTSFTNKKANLSLVEMGDAAFASLGWLYSSILHEYKHVQQHHALKDPANWDEDYAEVEAYAREIKRAKDTGVYNDKAQMEELWTRLHDNYWVNITDKKKKGKLKSLVKAAHKIAEKATGKKLTLTL
jgi:hypothetical protein